MRCIALVGMMGLSMLAGCPSDNNSQPDAGNCSCAPPTALQVTYDKTSSMLGATNVQDAVDELAARPLPEAPIEGRLEFVDQAVTNTGITLPAFEQPCPHPTDIALGGGCGPMFAAGTRLLGTTLEAHGYGCNYEQPASNTEAPHITVMCLHKAP